jgi:hypothetical protein
MLRTPFTPHTPRRQDTTLGRTCHPPLTLARPVANFPLLRREVWRQLARATDRAPDRERARPASVAHLGYGCCNSFATSVTSVSSPGSVVSVSFSFCHLPSGPSTINPSRCPCEKKA